MKRITVLVLAVIMSLTAIFLYSCGKHEPDKIEYALTVDNVGEYINLKVRCDPADFKYDGFFKSTYFDTITAQVEATSASPFLKFRDCEIVVRLHGLFDGEEIVVDVPVKIGLGGSGSNVVRKKIKSVNTYTGAFKNNDAIGGGTYEIISATGTVEEI